MVIVMLNELEDPVPTRHGFFGCGLRMTGKMEEHSYGEPAG